MSDEPSQKKLREFSDLMVALSTAIVRTSDLKRDLEKLRNTPFPERLAYVKIAILDAFSGDASLEVAIEKMANSEHQRVRAIAGILIWAKRQYRTAHSE